MELRTSVARGLAWTATGEWGRLLLAFLLFAVLARLLPPAAFGLLAFAMVLVGLAEILLDKALGDALVQRESLDPAHLDGVFWAQLALGLVLALLLALGAPLVEALTHLQGLAPVLQLLSPLFLLQPLRGVQESLLRRHLRFRALALRSLLTVVLGGAVGIALALAGYGVLALVGQQLVTGVTEVLVLWTASDWRPGFRFQATSLRELLPFAAPMAGHRFLDYANTRADDLLIGLVLGPVLLGYYVVAYRFLEALKDLVGGVAARVTFPAFSRLQRDRPRLARAYREATSLTTLLGVPAFLGLGALAPDVLQGLVGPQWGPSAPVLRVLVLYGALRAVLTFSANVLLALGRPGWRLGLTALTAVGNVAGFLVAVRFGLVAVAASLGVVALLLAPLELRLVLHLLDLRARDLLQDIAAPLVAALVMVPPVLWLDGLPLPLYPRLALAVLGGVAVHLAVVALLDRGLLERAWSLARATGGA